MSDLLSNELNGEDDHSFTVPFGIVASFTYIMYLDCLLNIGLRCFLGCLVTFLFIGSFFFPVF